MDNPDNSKTLEQRGYTFSKSKTERKGAEESAIARDVLTNLGSGRLGPRETNYIAVLYGPWATQKYSFYVFIQILSRPNFSLQQPSIPALLVLKLGRDPNAVKITFLKGGNIILQVFNAP